MPRLIKHSRFALNSFFFKANDNIGIENGLVNLKMTKKSLFFELFFRFLLRFLGKPVFTGPEINS